MSISTENMSNKGNAIVLGLGLIAAPFTGGFSLVYAGAHVAMASAAKAIKEDAADNTATK